MGEEDIGSTVVVVFWIDGPGWARGGEAGEGRVDAGRTGRVGESGEDVDGKNERGQGQEREGQLSHRGQLRGGLLGVT
jgi:hypothetical protein